MWSGEESESGTETVTDKKDMVQCANIFFLYIYKYI